MMTMTRKPIKTSLMLIVAILLLFSCATTPNATQTKKYQAAVRYYQAFSAGLHIATAALPEQYSTPANAALFVADRAVATLAILIDSQAAKDDIEAASIKASAAVEAANAAVGASL